MDGDIRFTTFKRDVNLTMVEICREIFRNNSGGIKIQKEEVAVRSLAKILEAALRLCNRKGFASMSLRDLSRESGVSLGAMYSYFSSKDDLLRLMQGHGRSVIVRILEGVISGMDDPWTRLRRSIQAHLYASEVLQPWFYLSYMETRNFPADEFKKALDSELYTERMFVDIIIDGQSRSLFRPVDAELLGSAIKSMLQDWYLKRWKYTGRKVSVEDYGNFMLGFIESYLIDREIS